MISLNKNNTFPIGLHLEPRSATLLQLCGTVDDLEVRSTAQSEMPFDENMPPDEQDRAIAIALKKLIADHDFKGRHVVSCLGAQELFTQNVRLPQLPPDEIEKVIHWEAEERLPYPVADAEVRFLPAAEVHQNENVKQEVILLACQQEVVNRHVGILEQAGLSPVAIDIEPKAILRSFHQQPHDDETHRRAYLNLGESATSVIFTEGENILFLKNISSGGHELNQVVAKHLNLDYPEAKRMRAEVTAASGLDSNNDIHRAVIDAIRASLDAMISEIELCLRYYKVTFRGKPMEQIVVTGSEASNWLVSYLFERLQTSCVLGNPFESLANSSGSTTSTDRPWRWSTAMGLSSR